MIPQRYVPISGKVDIFAIHSRFNLPEFKKVLYPDTMYVTVVREPAGLYESLYAYFSLYKEYRMSLERFVSLPLMVGRIISEVYMK